LVPRIAAGLILASSDLQASRATVLSRDRCGPERQHGDAQEGASGERCRPLDSDHPGSSGAY